IRAFAPAYVLLGFPRPFRSAAAVNESIEGVAFDPPEQLASQELLCDLRSRLAEVARGEKPIEVVADGLRRRHLHDDAPDRVLIAGQSSTQEGTLLARRVHARSRAFVSP
ncbi:hypothetical protein, partial [Escherichia coli]|uniref:hypothetical protein n=1 Tax=Escherichia coli TaxID=562 RepID=UPI001BE4D1A2